MIRYRIRLVAFWGWEWLKLTVLFGAPAWITLVIVWAVIK